MSKAVENLLKAQQFAMSISPKVGGFPYLAEALRKAGVTQNIWNLPACILYTLTNASSSTTAFRVNRTQKIIQMWR